MTSLKRQVIDNAKNVVGWRTQEQLVVFAVDDYGNVRLDSRRARDKLAAAGLDMRRRFDRFDAVETRSDLEALFDVLSSVTDGAGRPATFTPYALPANLDFDEARAGRVYRYEPLPRTFERLACAQPAAYEGAWALWQEGAAAGWLRPQFHGREHINVEVIERRFHADDPMLATNLALDSLAAVPDEPTLPGVGFTHGFGLWDKAELVRHRRILHDGLDLFEAVFGRRSTTFTPPALRMHPSLGSHAAQLGVKGVHKPLQCVRRLDRRRTQREANALGRRPGQDHITIVRNVVFEPTERPEVDSVALALDQIETAFRWRKPAIISSHRVNFAGHIDEDNRAVGLAALAALLAKITTRWPDVQFIGADELVDRMAT